MERERIKGPVVPLVAIAVLVAAVAGYYYWLESERQAAQSPATEAPATAEAEPAIRHPLPGTAPPEEAKRLPPLAESDEPLRETAAGLYDEVTLSQLFNLDSIVRRVVVTVDDLPRKKIARRYNLAKPVAGKFAVRGKEETLTIGAENYRRYAPYVALAEAVDPKKLAALYAHFYPLFQEEYQNLGYRKKYFNDRVVEAIDDLLAAPEMKEPVKLARPKVMYEYADPKLESLSAGQKIMLRMGPENAARIKGRLREFRKELTTVQ